MFGYITVYKPELKIKDYHKYRAYYCGLCRSLLENFGVTGQLTLSYDMTFVIVLLTSLYESETKTEVHRCKVHPVKKSPVLVNEMTVYSAKMNIVLSYYHFIDDWKDERSVRGLAGSAAMKKKVQKIEKEYPGQCKKIRQCLNRLSEMEAAGSQNIDETAGCFGDLMAELFVYKKDIWEPYLRRIGFYLGKFIYIMDAVDDIEKDIEKNRYNPLRSMHHAMAEEDFLKTCYQMLNMMMAEVSTAFEQLPCLWDEDILRNILYAGVWNRFNRLTEEKKQRKENQDKENQDKENQDKENQDKESQNKKTKDKETRNKKTKNKKTKNKETKNKETKNKETKKKRLKMKGEKIRNE